MNELTNTIFKVKKSPVVEKKSFIKAWLEIPYDEIRRQIRDELMDTLGWAISTFNYKKNGNTPLRENEIPVIQEIFNRFGLNPWTGERI